MRRIASKNIFSEGYIQLPEVDGGANCSLFEGNWDDSDTAARGMLEIARAVGRFAGGGGGGGDGGVDVAWELADADADAAAALSSQAARVEGSTGHAEVDDDDDCLLFGSIFFLYVERYIHS